MNEIGLCAFREPFARLFNQGMITAGGAKMSKSRGNVVNPLEYVGRYGADTVRMYTLFMGPANEDMDWQDSGLEGIWRFLNRIWRIAHEQAGKPRAGDPGTGALARKTHQTIAKVTDDIDRRFAFHTPIAAAMELVNEIQRNPGDPAARFATETAVSLIQPYVPHVAEEMWSVLGEGRLWEQPWPEADPGLLVADEVEIPVQVNGKVRDRLHVAPGIADEELLALALASERVQAHVDGRELRKTIVVPDKLVSLVV
jgi:leucyl-tRNA synthetase